MPSNKLNPKLPPKPAHSWAFEAIGTHWWIGIYQPVSSDALGTLSQAVMRRIDEFDAVYSRFRVDSLVTHISERPGTYQLPDDAAPLLAFYRQLYDISSGSVSPLVGQLLADAGYDATYSLTPGTLHDVPPWDDVMSYDDGRLITTAPVLLDFGAAGKGYLVDIVAQLLRAAGITQFCVDAGGDMACHGLAAPLRIGLENPDDAAQVIGVASLQTGALCGSAGNRRAWRGFTHIMDPDAKASATTYQAVWVSAKTAMLADGLTTALYFVSPQKLQAVYDFEYLTISSKNFVQQSAGFRPTLFTPESTHV